MRAARIIVALFCTKAGLSAALLQDSSISAEDEPTPSRTDENGKVVGIALATNVASLARKPSNAASLARKGTLNFPFANIVPTSKTMVLDEAKKHHKPAMVIVTGTSCPTCAGLWSSMGSSHTINHLMEKFVAVSLNENAAFNWVADKGHSEAYVPRVYFLNSDGRYFDAFATRSDFPTYAYSFTDSADLEDKMSKVLDTYHILEKDHGHHAHDEVHSTHNDDHHNDAHHGDAGAHGDAQHGDAGAHHNTNEANHHEPAPQRSTDRLYNARSALIRDDTIVLQESSKKPGVKTMAAQKDEIVSSKKPGMELHESNWGLKNCFRRANRKGQGCWIWSCSGGSTCDKKEHKCYCPVGKCPDAKNKCVLMR